MLNGHLRSVVECQTQYSVQKFHIVPAHFDITVLKRQQGKAGDTPERLEIGSFFWGVGEN